MTAWPVVLFGPPPARPGGVKKVFRTRGTNRRGLPFAVPTREISKHRAVYARWRSPNRVESFPC
jgi:hypothetical protein